MLLRLPPTQSAVTKYMSCVDYRPWPYVLLPVRHENSGDRIPHRKVGFANSVHLILNNISDKEISIATNDPVNIVHQLTTWAISNSIELPNLTIKEQSLEDLFLSWTQKQP